MGSVALLRFSSLLSPISSSLSFASRLGARHGLWSAAALPPGNMRPGRACPCDRVDRPSTREEDGKRDKPKKNTTFQRSVPDLACFGTQVITLTVFEAAKRHRAFGPGAGPGRRYTAEDLYPRY